MFPIQLSFIHPTQIFSILFFYTFVLSSQQVCNHHDQSALLAFSTNLSTSSLSPPLNWYPQVSCCQWEGIECDLNGRVTHLQLPSRSLKGLFITSSIYNLAMLTHLNLSHNHLHGSLGEDIIKLQNLKIMDLSMNSIVGSIPREIGKLLYLEKLHLYDNNLIGQIPSSLMNCKHIVEIILRDNNLNGDISTLDFSNLVKLQKLDLKTNSLSGTLPESLYSCKSLIAIRLSGNNFSSQTISPSIIELKSLSFLSLGLNNLTNIKTTLRILSNCKNLTTLLLSANFYGESLPTHKNFITSDDFPNLQFFTLAYCNFKVGPIPNWLSSLTSLRLVAMQNNRFMGRVPNWLGTLPKLFYLDLSNNGLSGELSLELWKFPALIFENAQLDLNSIEFELPVFLYYGNDSTPNSIRFKSNYYRGISLSNNSLSGNIPEEIGDLQNLQHIYLDNNQFSGQIPTRLSNLHKLEALDLSSNNFTGEIPRSLTNLHFLSYFDVSNNDLDGPIPTGSQFESFQEFEFEGNPDLCGLPLDQTCSSPATTETMKRNESYNKKELFVDGLFAGFVFGFSSVLVFVISCFWYHYCKRHQPSSWR